MAKMVAVLNLKEWLLIKKAFQYASACNAFNDDELSEAIRLLSKIDRTSKNYNQSEECE